MHIEISIPRPGITLLTIAAVSGWAMVLLGGPTAAELEAQSRVIEAPTAKVIEVQHAPALGAQEAVAVIEEDRDRVIQHASAPQPRMSQAEMRIRWARAEQDFLRQKDSIVREQLKSLQQQREALGEHVDPAIDEEIRRSVVMLTSLVKDQKKAEQFLLLSFRQMWEAEERMMAIVDDEPSGGAVALVWPVAPDLGISAGFLDSAYKKRFKVDHYAIDIPVAQGTDAFAAHDGVVEDVVDHGLGYNYVTIKGAGYATVYGHLSEFAVRPGQRVRAGDRIGRTGGMPGLPGGGSSTGPHLHFGLYIKGSPVDPTKYLPEYRA